MSPQHSIHEEMSQVVGLVRRYLSSRLEAASIETLNRVIRDLRVVLQQLVANYFLHLSLPQARQFRAVLTDRLLGLCSELDSRCTQGDGNHHRYCVKEVMACFEWAEQIKEEVPDDPITQKILAVDIPILRPFDYGLKKNKN